VLRTDKRGEILARACALLQLPVDDTVSFMVSGNSSTPYAVVIDNCISDGCNLRTIR